MAFGGYCENNISITSPVFTTTAASFSFHGTCEYVGCEIGEDLIEYLDGEVIGNCLNCGRRIRLARVPGGTNLTRLRAIIVMLGSGERGPALAEWVEAREELKEELPALREAEALAQLITDMIESGDVAPSV
jgi:hypothetical protein